AALYLSHVRSSLIVLAVSLITYGTLLSLQRRNRQASALLLLSSAVLGGAFLYALTLGGDSVSDRFASLLSEDPGTTYANSRGNQVAYALREYLPEYPLGAGLARWGMMRVYFGD